MHIGKCVPMIALCLLLCGCKEQAEETDIRAAYREMSGCELTMKVVCGEAQREWVATLQCHYAPEGESTVEVTEPLELAGVRAVLREADWSLEYSDLCLNIGPLSAEQISPATVPVRMLNALREGWLLEVNTEERQDIPCVRLALEQTGSGGGDIVTTIWLQQTDGTPVFVPADENYYKVWVDVSAQVMRTDVYRVDRRTGIRELWNSTYATEEVQAVPEAVPVET